MADEGFPLPGSSYKELIKIIQGYGRISTDASLADVSKLTAIGETIISANNKFLVAVGLIQGGKRKAITPIGAQLSNALQYEMVDDIASRWRATVEANDFLQKVVAAVRIRKGMDQSSLESHVAYSAGQPKTPAVATGARTIVDILVAAGLLKEEAGDLIATTPEPPSIPQTVEESLSISPSYEIVRRIGTRSARLASVHLNIEVRVQCTPGDLDNLGAKLQKVLQDFYDDSPTHTSTSTAPPASPPPTPLVPPTAGIETTEE